MTRKMTVANGQIPLSLDTSSWVNNAQQQYFFASSRANCNNGRIFPSPLGGHRSSRKTIPYHSSFSRTQRSEFQYFLLTKKQWEEIHFPHMASNANKYLTSLLPEDTGYWQENPDNAVLTQRTEHSTMHYVYLCVVWGWPWQWSDSLPRPSGGHRSSWRRSSTSVSVPEGTILIAVIYDWTWEISPTLIKRQTPTTDLYPPEGTGQLKKKKKKKSKCQNDLFSQYRTSSQSLPLHNQPSWTYE